MALSLVNISLSRCMSLTYTFIGLSMLFIFFMFNNNWAYLIYREIARSAYPASPRGSDSLCFSRMCASPLSFTALYLLLISLLLLRMRRRSWMLMKFEDVAATPLLDSPSMITRRFLLK